MCIQSKLRKPQWLHSGDYLPLGGTGLTTGRETEFYLGVIRQLKSCYKVIQVISFDYDLAWIVDSKTRV